MMEMETGFKPIWINAHIYSNWEMGSLEYGEILSSNQQRDEMGGF